MLAVTRYIGAGQSRSLGGIEKAAVSLLGLACVAALLALVLGWDVDRGRTMALFLGAMLAVTFLTTNGSPRRPRTTTPAGIALALLSLAICGYFFLEQQAIQERLPMVTTLTSGQIVAAFALLLVILEATRRTMGMSLLVVVGAFLVYAIWGHLVEGAFSHRRLASEEIIDQLVFTPNGIFGAALTVATFLVFIFVAFGSILDRLGGGTFFFDLSAALVGRQPGGPAKVAIVSSGLYGTISGSPTADVVTTGAFTIPLMIRVGYSRIYSAAIEATASTGGALLPPVMGTAAFLMSDFTGIAYSKIAASAVIGAMLYYFTLFVATDAMARHGSIGAFPPERITSLATVLRRDWYFFVPIALLVWFCFHGDRPTYGAGWAILAMLAIALVRDRAPVVLLHALVEASAETAKRASTVVVACAMAGIVVGTLAITDLSGKFTSLLFSFAPDQLLFVLVISALVTLILGMGMPTPAVYMLAAVLLAPAIVKLGVSLLAAHLFIVYYASMSAITPPIAVAAFAAASIAEANPFRIGLACCRLAIIAFLLPFLFIYQPALVLQAPAPVVAMVAAMAFAGTFAATVGWEGYLWGRLSPPSRLALVASGVLLLWPLPAANAVGATGLAAVVAMRWIAGGRAAGTL